MSQKIQITINGKPATVVRDSYLLGAIQEAGIQVPTLCHHKDLAPNGTCRLCVVEIEVRGKKKLVTSCNYPVREEIAVETDSERVRKHRRVLAEMYLGRWPNVPIVRDLAKRCGVTDGSRFASDLSDAKENACILCTHCVRGCHEFMQEDIIDFASRGIKRHLTMPFGEMDPHCVGCTSCAYVCPTGAIQVVDDLNHPVDARLIRDHGMKQNAEMARLDDQQCRMRHVGTANIVDVMDQYDLLPVHNYQYGSHEDAPKIYCGEMEKHFLTQGEADGCWFGCSMGCAKAAEHFVLQTGPYKGDAVLVDGPEYETAAAGANMGCFDLPFILEWNFYCDTYGIDTISYGTCMAFVMECFENGIIDKEYTGGLELRFGSTEDALECLHQMARGEGFGKEMGQGIAYLKEKFIRERGADPAFLKDIGMEVKGLEFSEYVSKESLAQQAGYSMAVKGPQHDEAWLIFMDMVNNQIPTFEDKAEALYYFPLWRTWFGLLGLCKLPWNDVVPSDNSKHPPLVAAKIPDHTNNYYKFFEGMTGKKLDEAGMLEQSARVHNLQRIMSFMLGKGTREHDLPPYRAMGPVTTAEYESRAERYDKQLKEILGYDPEGKSTDEKLKVLREYRENQYENVLEVAYERRGWSKKGLPTPDRLKELGIDLPELLEAIKDA